MTEQPKPERGRPSKFEERFIKQAEAMSALGLTDAEMAEVFDVSVRTLHRWKLESDPFCHALRAGKDVADERVARALYQNATGYDYRETQAVKVKVGQHEEKVELVEVERHKPAETTAGIFWLKNRRKDEWRDKVDHELSGPNGGPMQTETKLDVAGLSEATLRELAGLRVTGEK